MGVAMSAAKITVWGDPSAVERMTKAFLGGQAVGRTIEGFTSSTPPNVMDVIEDGVEGLGVLASAALKRLTGMDIPADRIDQALREQKELLSKGKPSRGNGADNSSAHGA